MRAPHIVSRLTQVTLLTATAFSAAHAADAPPATTYKIVENNEWRPLNTSDLHPKPGTALDLSRFVTPGPAGKYGRVIASPRGFLAFEQRPNVPVRFNACTLGPELALDGAPGRIALGEKKDIEAYAENVRLQGYNLVRLHFLDHALTNHAERDGEFDPVVLDRMDYLLKCLKDRGIYIYLDAASSWRAYVKGPHWWQDSWKPRMKQRIFTDQPAKDLWEQGVTKLLTHVNPYTGTTLAKDPIVATLLFFNEQELECYAKPFAELRAPWQAFLRKKYGTFAALKKAWDLKDDTLKDVEDFDAIPLWAADQFQRQDTRGHDIADFVIELENDLVRWYKEKTKAIGYDGLVSHFDYYLNTFQAVPRSQVNVISLHHYFAHPSDYNKADSKISQDSALAASADYFGKEAAMRFSDRPLMFTEYGHVYWNKYRYEAGLTIGAYGSFQNFDLLGEHADPVVWRGREIRPFDAGNDPISRASQVVTGYIFHRADVAPSTHLVQTTITPEDLSDPRHQTGTLSNSMANLALLTRVGLAYPAGGSPHPVKPISPDMEVNLDGDLLWSKPTKSQVSTSALVQRLRDKGILPPGNKTDIAKGIYESDNGQILLNSQEKSLAVTASRLAGVCFETLKAPATAGALTVQSATLPASLTAISVDDTDLKTSRRILVVLATDARNSDSEYKDATQTVLVNNGKLPILMRSGTFQLSLTRTRREDLKAWAIGFNGERQEEIPVRTFKDHIELTLDTKSLKTGPTPFFEIAAR